MLLTVAVITGYGVLAPSTLRAKTLPRGETIHVATMVPTCAVSFTAFLYCACGVASSASES